MDHAEFVAENFGVIE